MKKRPFYFEIKNLITQFMGAFNDIAIKRYDENRNTDGNYVGVGFMYAPKQRVIEDIINKSRTIPLPAVSISINSIARDPERVFNKIDGHYIHTSQSTDVIRAIPQPVPVNIGINMSIIARYQTDAEQILSNFIPYCDPYVTISWKLPTTEDTSYQKEIRTIIEWSGNINTQYPVELSSNQLARVTYDTTFNIKGWLFKQIDEVYGKIYEVNTNFIPSNLGDSCFVFNNTTETIDTYDNSLYSDNFALMAKPTIKNIDSYNYFIGTSDTNTVYNLFGKDFFNITDMYLTSTVDGMFTDVRFYEPFKDTKFASTYPGFYGKKITTYFTSSLNNIQFTIPELITKTGFFDVIIKNEAGYSILSRDSFISPITITPNNPYQPPCINGIHVVKV